jgi:hypothetical protein
MRTIRASRGGPPQFSTGYDTRTSFCCACCRKRLPPPSVPIRDRKVFLGAIVVLASVGGPDHPAMSFS